MVLKTRDKNITLDGVQGSVEIVDKNGDVHLTSVAPLAAISVQNTHGSVDVGLPQGASFTVNAQTHNGDLENDFGFSQQDDGENHSPAGFAWRWECEDCDLHDGRRCDAAEGDGCPCSSGTASARL